MIAGIRSMVQLASAPAWKGYIIAHPGYTDEHVMEYVRENTVTIWKPVGTCAMAAADASKGEGVVDNRLRVKGAQGLRVGDASVFPRMPAGHPTAPVYMIAERASDLIREDWLTGYRGLEAVRVFCDTTLRQRWTRSYGVHALSLLGELMSQELGS
ncbi:GMC oxidoreductase-domain-containing protein [Coniochaeta sp. 2T2.1]|nr:GMC oxidoreductase-domain-containing protein [Coniochaeta sp. 2T2.1]